MSDKPDHLYTSLSRVYLLRELQRHFGEREFRHRDIKNVASIHGSDSPVIPSCLKKNGHLDHLGNGKYRLSKQSLKLLKEAREILI